MDADDRSDAQTVRERPTGPPPLPTPGERLPERFQFIAEIARGGMGRVIEAFDQRLGRTVALKQTLDGSDAIRQRFAREVAITARLEHPSIVPVYDAGTVDGEPFYVMRKVAGAPLDARVRAAGSLDRRLLLVPHVLAMADAIAHAHQRGVIHRDLKPSNVLVGELGETIVIDWGLAKQVGEADAHVVTTTAAPGVLETRAGAVFGTPGFMAPEQADAEPTDARTDVYALGACLFYVLAGRPPFVGAEDDVLAQTRRGTLPELALLAPGVPPDLVTIVGKALARAPADRYLDGGGVAEELRRFLGGQLVASHRYGARQRVTRWLRRHRALVVAVAAGTAIAVVVGATSLQRVLTAQASTQVALDAERERGDELVIAQAAAYLDTDPTRAVATLQHLRPESPRWPTLVPLLADATARGIAVGYPGHGAAAEVSFAPGAGPPRLLSSGGGTVRLIEPQARRVTTLVDNRPTALAMWAGDLVVLTGADREGGAEVLDPKTMARAPLAWPQPLRTIDAAGGVVALVDLTGQTATLDVTTLPLAAPRLVPHAAPATEGYLSPTGRWLVLRGPGTQIFERTAATWQLVAERGPGHGTPAFAADGSRVALIEDAVVELALPAATEAHRCAQDGTVRELAYVGPDLVAVQGALTLQVAQCTAAGALARVLETDLAAHATAGGAYDYPHPVAAAGGLLAVMAATRTIAIGLPAFRRELRAPLDVLGIALDPSGRWLVGTSMSEVLVWDLAASRDRTTDLAGAGFDGIAFFDAHALVVSRTDGDMRALELRDVTAEPFAIAAAEPLGRVALENEIDVAGDGAAVDRGGAHATARVLRPAVTGATAATTLADGRLVTGTAAGTIAVGDHALGALPGPITQLTARAGWLAARSPTGLWRSDPAGHLETAGIARAGSLVFGAAGTLYVVTEHELYAWPAQGAPGRVAAFADATDSSHETSDGAVAVTTADGSLVLYDPALQRVRTLFHANLRRGLPRYAFARNGAVAAAELDDGVAAVDLRTGAHWMIAPHLHFDALALSPDGTVLLAIAGGRVHRFDVRVPAPSPAWVRAATNALAPAGAGELGWREAAP